MNRWLNKIICGDCLEVMREMPDECVDLVLTDPPYLKLKSGLRVTLHTGVAGRRNEGKTVADPWNANWDWLKEAWRVTKHGLLCFCSYHSVADVPPALGIDPAAVITWYGRNSMPSMCNVPQYQTEFIWFFKKTSDLNWRKLKTFYEVNRLHAGCMAGERIVNKSGQAIHPTQKPLQLIKKLLEVGGDTILDPFLGSGTTAVAAAQLGRNFIGIEISPEYCRIAEERLKRETAQLNMFVGAR